MPDPRVQQGVQFSGICSKLILEGRSRQQPLFLERGLTACPSVGASSSKHRLDSGSGKGQCSWNENYIDRSKSSATEFPKGLPEPVSSRQRHRWEENRLLPGKIPLLQLLTAFVGAWSMSQREMHRLDWPLQEQVWNLVGKMVSPRFSLLVQSYSPPPMPLLSPYLAPLINIFYLMCSWLSQKSMLIIAIMENMDMFKKKSNHL